MRKRDVAKAVLKGFVGTKIASKTFDAAITITACVSSENDQEIWFDVEGRFSTLAEMLVTVGCDLADLIKDVAAKLELIPKDRMRIRIATEECREKSLTGFIYQI